MQGNTVNKPTENFFDNGGRVHAQQLLGRIHLIAGCVVLIVGPEHAVDVVEKVAPCRYALCYCALLEENEVVHVNVGIAETVTLPSGG